MSVWNAISALTIKTAADVTALLNRIKNLELGLKALEADVSIEREDWLADHGVWSKTSYYRPDGSLARVDEYEGTEGHLDFPNAPNVLRKLIYAKDGINVKVNHRFALEYDSEGRIIKKTLTV